MGEARGTCDAGGTLPACGPLRGDEDFPMPLMCTRFAPGGLWDAVESVRGEGRRAIARAEAFYFTAQPDEACAAAEPHLESPDLALRMSACLICAYANLSLNRPALVRRCLDGLASAGKDERLARNDALRASHVLLSTASSVLLHLPSPYSEREAFELAHLLPEGLRLFASYVGAHGAYLAGEYGRCIGMAENALAMKQGTYPISELFLCLVAAMGWVSLKDVDRADRLFMRAWDIARPDDLIEELGEHHGLLQGVLEACLRDVYPQDMARILRVTRQFSYGWRRVHNPETGDAVADDLTTTEFAMAMLACRGWSNEQIAAHMGVSRGTVKNRLSSAYVKLGVSGRSELAKFMLR